MYRLIGAFFMLLTFCNAWIEDVDRHSSSCFFEKVKSGIKLSLTFEVIQGGFLDIDVEIKGPDDLIIYNGIRESSGKYTFAAYKDGKYTFCFNNLMSAVIKKQVMFDVLVGHIEHDQSDEMTNQNVVLKKLNDSSTNSSENKYKSSNNEANEIAAKTFTDWSVKDYSLSANQSERLKRMVISLSAGLDGVAHEQEYLLARNSIHQRLNENTNAVVVHWAVFQLTLILVGSAFQIWYIKRFFEVRRII